MNILNFFKFIISELSELRWRIVPLICSLSVGSMYVYDFPGSFGMNTDGNQKQDSIQALFEKHGKQYTNTMNELLYSVYNYPNMLLCLIGGIALDKVLGLRLGTVVFSFLVTLGSLLFWLGIKYVSFPLMVTGRTIYGLGGESLCVAQNAFLVKWFHGAPTLGVAFTLMVLFGRVGSALNFLITLRAAASSGVAWAACTGTLVCAGSTLIALFLFLLDRTFESPSQKNLPSEVNVTDCEKDSESLIAKEKIKYHHLPLTLWFMAISCALFYNSVMPFNSFAIPFFVQKYGITDIQSAADVSLFQLVSAISSPCMGLLYDLTGRGCFRLLVAPIFIAGSYIVQLFLPTSAAASMVWMALNYSLYASTIWPSVPLATTPEQRGIAYGLISAMQNTAGSTIPVGIGALLDKYTVRTTNLDSTTSAKGYNIVLILLAVVACVSALFSALLWVQDSRTTKKINAGRRTTDCDAQP